MSIATSNWGWGNRGWANSRQSDYAQKVLNTAKANLIAYWPLWEPSGSVADNYEGTAARDGAYTGVTLGQTGIGDGRTAPLFDGVNDFTNVYTASFVSAFNKSEGTLLIWGKPFSTYTGTGVRNLVSIEYANNSNTIKLWHDNAGAVFVTYQQGGTTKQTSGSPSDGVFTCFVATWSIAANQLKLYFNGTQVGSTQTGLVAPLTTMLHASIGVRNDAAPDGYFYGWLAHCAVWTTPLTQNQITTLAAV